LIRNASAAEKAKLKKWVLSTFSIIIR
jgi:hypothetical protein